MGENNDNETEQTVSEEEVSEEEVREQAVREQAVNDLVKNINDKLAKEDLTLNQLKEWVKDIQREAQEAGHKEEAESVVSLDEIGTVEQIAKFLLAVKDFFADLPDNTRIKYQDTINRLDGFISSCITKFKLSNVNRYNQKKPSIDNDIIVEKPMDQVIHLDQSMSSGDIYRDGTFGAGDTPLQFEEREDQEQQRLVSKIDQGRQNKENLNTIVKDLAQHMVGREERKTKREQKIETLKKELRKKKSNRRSSGNSLSPK